MTTRTTVLKPALASSISDPAFRLYCVLVLHIGDGWAPVPLVAEKRGLKPHQIRLHLAELHAAGMIKRDRRYERGATGRPTWHTYVCLDDNATVDAA
ncbi:hypothetical protein [Streptomyces hirsutus]|uniref:hypothetical protein n=1 Tax=Streptomyces hirsutus TaxID=35620 RepID=UPI0033259DCC